MTTTPGGVLVAAANLEKSHGSTVALRDASISVDRGEAVAVLGPSGSGKSTLLYCLAGVLVPDRGSVELGTARVHDMSDRARARLRRTRFGFVFQFAGLLPELTAEENVALPLMLDGASRRAAVGRARALFAPLGLDGLTARRPGQLSGGQAQRVAVARALVTEPAVVFADEPTGSLDSETGREVMSLLTAAVRTRGAALVLVTHDARVAASCDRSVEVVDGVTRQGVLGR